MGSENIAQTGPGAADVSIRKRLGLLGRKVGMTQVVLPSGRSVPVTVIEAGPCTVVQKKTASRDGYEAVQLGFSSSKAHRENKASIGHAAKAGKGTFSVLREFQGAGHLDLGATVTVSDLFRDGDKVQVTGRSKGRGYSGVMKRHNFAGFPGSHGTHEYFRHGGSIGMRTTPGRVNRGKRMCGHMGDEQVTVQNLKIVKIDLEKNIVLIEGAVPGAPNGPVVVRQSIKKLGKALQKKKTAA